MRSVQPPVVLIAVLAGVTACATIVGGTGDMADSTDKTVQTMFVASSPSEATITVTDEKGATTLTAVTPRTLYLKKSGGYWHAKSYKVAISKPGYETQTIAVDSRETGWYYVGNLGLAFVFLTGVIGWFVVDPMNGYMYELSPDYIVVTLKPEPSR